MQDGERLVRWLTFQDVDRPPFYQHFHGWDMTHERWWRESGVRRLDLRAYFNEDFGFETVPVPFGVFPPFEREIVEDHGDVYIERDERGILLRQRRDKGSIPGFIEHPVKGWADWEKFKKERYNPDHPARWHADLDAFSGYIKATGAAAVVGVYPNGVFGTARDLMGAENLLAAFIEKPDLVHDIMDSTTDAWIRMYDRVTKHVKVSCIHLWEDMAGRNGSLISPRMVRDFMMPNYRKVRDFASAKGIPLISVDSDGDVSQLVPLMMENGVNVYFPFEVQAGSDVEEYRRKYPRLGIMGGLDKRALAEDRKAIDRELARAERLLKKGGYIPGPDHVVPPNVPFDNYRYFMERLKEMAGKK
jgi:uroporphyrinogen decarboxylase